MANDSASYSEAVETARIANDSLAEEVACESNAFKRKILNNS